MWQQLAFNVIKKEEKKRNRERKRIGRNRIVEQTTTEKIDVFAGCVASRVRARASVHVCVIMVLSDVRIAVQNIIMHVPVGAIEVKHL